jgi:hypothetical protein
LHRHRLTRLAPTLHRRLLLAYHRDRRAPLQFAGMEPSQRKTTPPGASRDPAAHPPPLPVAGGSLEHCHPWRSNRPVLPAPSISEIQQHLDSPTRVSTSSISPCSPPSVLSLNRTLGYRTALITTGQELMYAPTMDRTKVEA